MNRKFTKSIFALFAMAFGFSVQMTAQTLVINEPASIAGEYEIGLAAFGEQFSPCDGNKNFTGDVQIGVQAGGLTTACLNDGALDTDLTAFIGLVDRGTCSFVEKATLAQQAGATALIICNNDPEGGVIGLAGDDPDITIPVVMISLGDCESVKMEISSSNVNASIIYDASFLENPTTINNILWSDDFSNGLDNWETVGISAPVDGLEVADAVWTYTPDGSSPGCFAGSGFIETESGCDGAALFDFQGYQTQGCSNTDVSSGLLIESDLISPVIDLSQSGPVVLHFTQFNIPLNGDNSVSYSVDGGVTWSDPILVATENVLTSVESNVVGNEFVSVPLPQLAGQQLARFKFTANNDFYFWLIDEVALAELQGVDVRFDAAFNTPFTYAVPQAHGDADEFFFGGTFSNTGSIALDNLTLDVDVQDSNGNSVYSDSGALTPLGVGEVETFSVIDNTWFPTGLDTGLYTVNLNVTSGFEENNMEDNSGSFQFRITESTWAKDDGARFIRNGNGVPYKIATTYVTSENAGMGDLEVRGATVSLGASNDDSSFMTDNFVELYLVQLNDDINPFNPGDTGFDINQTDIPSNTSYEILAQTTYVFTDEPNFELLTIPFDGGAPIELDPGAGYMLILEFSSAQAGSATQRNQDLLYAYDERVDASGAAIIFDEEDDFGNAAQWFLGGFGDGTVLRLEYSLNVNTDDVPLPEGTFTAFPNPATDYINASIDFDEPTTGTLFFATIDGKIISTKQINNVTTANEQFNVADLPSGMYIVRLSTEVGSKTYKVAVQH